MKLAWTGALLHLALVWTPGCMLPDPSEGGEGNEVGEPARVMAIAADADRLQEKGLLREAIELVERGLIDHPMSYALRTRLSELRFQRQICFADDWHEAEALCSRDSRSQAMARLQRIEAYGDEDMVRRARARIEEIGGRAPRTGGAAPRS